MHSYLGIDFGTSGCRACLIDETGSLLAEVDAALPEPARNGTAVQQDPTQWWDGMQALFAGLEGHPALRALRAIAVDGTSSTLMLCEADGTPTTPALMYNDTRAVKQVQRLAAVADPGSAVINPGSSLAKLLWLLDQKPHKRVHALHQADWLAGRLCGRFDVSDTHNALKLGFEPRTGAWPQWMAKLALAPGILPTVQLPGTPIGELLPALAAQWKLPAGVEILAGTTDSTAGVLATGIHTPGQAVTSLGSTLVLKVLSPEPVFAPAYGIYSHRIPAGWLVGGASNTGGAVLRGFFTSEQLVELSKAIDPTTASPLDYYPLPAPGERFPVADTTKQPRLHPRPDDDAEFLHGLFEGIARIEAQGYRRLNELGAPYPTEVISVGGGAANSVWRAIRERILGCPVRESAQVQAAYGSALLARGN